ncbi:hypothetical protein GCM10008012_37680 [Rhizobium anhuiense]|nr:hypothetical protein GCM10008012_37680 [Rhizobium anhuiense]
MGGRQQPLHDIVRQGIGQELAANVAPRLDRVIDGLALGQGKTGRRRKGILIKGSHRQIPNNATARRPRGSVNLARPVF